MATAFSQKLSELRRKMGVSQRVASGDLRISQALLSHYENGLREPGLELVSRACDYYGVSADYILGRSEVPAHVTPAIGDEAVEGLMDMLGITLNLLSLHKLSSGDSDAARRLAALHLMASSILEASPGENSAPPDFSAE